MPYINQPTLFSSTLPETNSSPPKIGHPKRKSTSFSSPHWEFFRNFHFLLSLRFFRTPPHLPLAKIFSENQPSQARGTIICWSSGDKALNSEETRSSNWCRSMKSSTSPLLTQVVKDFWFFFPQKNDGIYEGMTLTVHESQMCKF